MSRSRSRVRRWWAAAAVAGGTALAALAAALVLTGPALAADRSFTVAFATSPPVYAGADSAPLTATITNTSGTPQELGAVRLTFPSPLVPLAGTATTSRGTVTVTGQQIDLGYLGLQPGESATLGLRARVERCTPGTLSVTGAGKQANEFNGTGNDFPAPDPAPVAVTGSCTLAFVTGPASAQKATDITGDVFLPFTPAPGSTNPVSVEVRDGSGAARATWWSTPVVLGIAANPGAATLTGTVSRAPVAGVATFRDPAAAAQGPRIGVSASGYTLRATSAGIAAASAPSAPFDVVDVGKRCVGNGNCSSGTVGGPKSSAKVDAVVTNGTIVRVSVGPLGVSAPVCAGYVPATDLLDFDVTTPAGVPTGGQRTVVFTLLAPYVTKSASKYDACFQSTLPFVTRSGAPATPTGGGFYTGLLPDCDRRSPVAPCEVGTERSRTGDIVMTLIAPPVDPRARF